MRNKQCRSAAVFVVMLMFASLAVAVVASSDDSSAAEVQPAYIGGDDIDVQAGASKTYRLDITNNTANDIYVMVSASITSSGSENFSITTKAYNSDYEERPTTVRLSPNQYAIFVVTIAVDKFTSHGDYTLTLNWSAKDISLETEVASGTKAVNLNIDSTLSPSESFNKFLGFIDNTLSSPFDQLWFTVIVTIIGFILIGLAIMCAVVPIVTRLMTRKDDPDRPILRKTLIHQCLIMVLVFTAVNTLCICGIDERLTDTLRNFARLIYLINILIIVWRIYKTFLDRLADHLRGRDMIPGGEVQDFDAFKPLFLYIGEIIIALVALFVGLGFLGVDTAAIITSAGLVTLGITFGAQQVLSQFFAGLVILSTRPFKKGDLIQFSGDSTVYRVRKVNVMNSELENWDNSDITIVPNNTITSNRVKNITRDTLRTKLHLYVSVSYDTDLAKARAALIDVANANPRVIKDGSVSRPSTRMTEFEDSNIQLRLTVWVDDYNDSGVIAGDLRVAIFSKFNEEGINIDYTQIVVRTYDPAPITERMPGDAKTEKA